MFGCWSPGNSTGLDQFTLLADGDPDVDVGAQAAASGPSLAARVLGLVCWLVVEIIQVIVKVVAALVAGTGEACSLPASSPCSSPTNGTSGRCTGWGRPSGRSGPAAVGSGDPFSSFPPRRPEWAWRSHSDGPLVRCASQLAPSRRDGSRPQFGHFVRAI
jgi:hypothetical protein